MNHSTPGLPVHHHLSEFTQTHVHRVGDAIQPSHPLSLHYSFGYRLHAGLYVGINLWIFPFLLEGISTGNFHDACFSPYSWDLEPNSNPPPQEDPPVQFPVLRIWEIVTTIGSMNPWSIISSKSCLVSMQSELGVFIHFEKWLSTVVSWNTLLLLGWPLAKKLLSLNTYRQSFFTSSR